MDYGLLFIVVLVSNVFQWIIDSVKAGMGF